MGLIIDTTVKIEKDAERTRVNLYLRNFNIFVFFQISFTRAQAHAHGMYHKKAIFIVYLHLLLSQLNYILCDSLSTPNNKCIMSKPVIFCGPSGVGKGTLIEMLMKRFPKDTFGFSVSHTTRYVKYYTACLLKL